MTEWRRCPTHDYIDGARNWGCPDCVAELRREVARNKEIVTAAKNLVAVNGRHHSEVAYTRLVEAVKQAGA